MEPSFMGTVLHNPCVKAARSYPCISTQIGDANPSLPRMTGNSGRTSHKLDSPRNYVHKNGSLSAQLGSFPSCFLGCFLSAVHVLSFPLELILGILLGIFECLESSSAFCTCNVLVISLLLLSGFPLIRRLRGVRERLPHLSAFLAHRRPTPTPNHLNNLAPIV